MQVAKGSLDPARTSVLQPDAPICRPSKPARHRPIGSTHGNRPMKSTQDVAAELASLDSKINAYLPPQYAHCYASVSPNSMGSAGLIYGPGGKVAWNQIWTTFCELALAGGPPHRGKLLEPVPGEEVAAEPARYAAVVAEI